MAKYGPAPAVELNHPDLMHVSDENKLGSGQFGIVYKVTLDGAKLHNKTKLTGEFAAKSCQSVKQDDIVEFFSEIALGLQFDHPNVIKTEAVVTQSAPYFLVTELMACDLKLLLQNNQPNHGAAGFSVREMLAFARDAAVGLEYLAEQHFVHRDIAARNLLLSGENTVKITDFGLSRKIDTKSDYYRQGGITMLPVRWMAPECLSDGKFTAASDMWSFSVCAWEKIPATLFNKFLLSIGLVIQI